MEKGNKITEVSLRKGLLYKIDAFKYKWSTIFKLIRSKHFFAIDIQKQKDKPLHYDLLCYKVGLNDAKNISIVMAERIQGIQNNENAVNNILNNLN